MDSSCSDRLNSNEDSESNINTTDTGLRLKATCSGSNVNISEGHEEISINTIDVATVTNAVPALPSSLCVNHFNGCLVSQAVSSNDIQQHANKRSQSCSSQSQAAASRSDTNVYPKLGSRACDDHSKSGLHLNGLVSTCAQTSNLVSLQPIFLSASEPVVAVNSQMGHVNGNGAYSQDLISDDNFDTGVDVDHSDHCHKGARPKRLRKRTRRDDQHAKTAFSGAVFSDTDEDEVNVPAGISIVRPNVFACSRLAGRRVNICNGGVTHDLPLSLQHSGCEQHADNRNDHLGCMQPAVSPQRDEDLVDEGAVCDFDRNVLADENIAYADDTSIISPVDGSNEQSNYLGRRTLHSLQHPLMQEGRNQASSYMCYNLSDSEDDLFRQDNGRAVGHVNEKSVEQDIEDNGDFIDADLPSRSGPLLSSCDSASLSSVNGDSIESVQAPVSSDKEHPYSRVENDLSGGSDKELNHKQDSPPDLQTIQNDARMRTSCSSLGQDDGGFDNFLVTRDLSSSDCSESENEEELNEGPLQTNQSCQETTSSVSEGAGVAEALVTPLNDQQLREQHFGAGGDVTGLFHFERSCCLQDSHLSVTSCIPQTFSAARHCSSSHLPTDLPSEGGAGGACAPPPSVNNLSRLHPSTSGSRPGEAMANGLDDVAPSNFINDESNRQQKVFDKFPMMEEGRDGSCGSGAGQAKCDNDNVLYPYPVAPAPGILYGRASGDRTSLQDQGTLGTLGPNVESYRRPHYKCSFGDSHWKANSESGVSEPAYEEGYGYRLCSSSDCCMAHNTFHQQLNKVSKDARKKQIVCRPIENGTESLPSVERFMIWTEYEAYLSQVKQIGLSACGQTAVLNLLKAFELPAEKEDVCNTIQVNLRKEKASIAEYLASRAVAGTTAEDLLSGVEQLTRGDIRGRFFQLWPPRNVQLLTWLWQWMKQGAVPIATLNLQQGVKQQQIPDAWHHQMVYGVGPRGVYLTNPLEIVPEETIMEQLMSDSVLLVRRQDVVSRFQPTASLAPLLYHPDPRWCTMNVIGQVVNVLREHNMPNVPGYRAQVTSHIRIPAVYRAGITLYVRHNTAQWKALCSAPDLPLLSSIAKPN